MSAATLIEYIVDLLVTDDVRYCNDPACAACRGHREGYKKTAAEIIDRVNAHTAAEAESELAVAQAEIDARLALSYWAFTADVNAKDYYRIAVYLRALLAAETERAEEARAMVSEANNSLYGSQGYFHSLNGGDFDKYHLARGIEDLKETANKRWSALTAAQAEIARLREALTEIRNCTSEHGGAGKALRIISAALAPRSEEEAADGNG